ncbi:unnamed protein product, partial [Amoebophrya sp. A120]|eukprot:GSA120T00013163001.1
MMSSIRSVTKKNKFFSTAGVVAAVLLVSGFAGPQQGGVAALRPATAFNRIVGTPAADQTRTHSPPPAAGPSQQTMGDHTARRCPRGLRCGRNTTCCMCNPVSKDDLRAFVKGQTHKGSGSNILKLVDGASCEAFGQCCPTDGNDCSLSSACCCCCAAKPCVQNSCGKESCANKAICDAACHCYDHPDAPDYLDDEAPEVCLWCAKPQEKCSNFWSTKCTTAGMGQASLGLAAEHNPDNQCLQWGDVTAFKIPEHVFNNQHWAPCTEHTVQEGCWCSAVKFPCCCCAWRVGTCGQKTCIKAWQSEEYDGEVDGTTCTCGGKRGLYVYVRKEDGSTECVPAKVLGRRHTMTSPSASGHEGGVAPPQQVTMRGEDEEHGGRSGSGSGSGPASSSTSRRVG